NNGELRYSVWSNETWTSFTKIGDGITTSSTPHLVNDVGVADLVFIGDNKFHYSGSYQSNAWSPGAANVGTSPQAFGPSPASISALGGSVRIAYAGDDGDLYDQSRLSGVWSAGNAHNLGNYTNITPTIIVTKGISSEYLVVLVKLDGTI